MSEKNHADLESRRRFNKLLTLAVGGAIAGSALQGCAKEEESSGDGGTKIPENLPKHACKGLNACKGQGGCKTGDGGCAGKNTCKGKGGCATVAHHSCAGKNDCKGLGGCKSGNNGCAAKNDCKGKGGCAVPIKH